MCISTHNHAFIELSAQIDEFRANYPNVGEFHWNGNVVEVDSRTFNGYIQYMVHNQNGLAGYLMKEIQYCIANVAEL